MECATRNKIVHTVEKVRKISFEEKINSSEEKMNAFLDAILDFKDKLSEKSTKITELADTLEEITWFEIEKEDNECLMLLNDLIAQAKDLYSSLIRNYVVFNPLRQKGIAKEAIKNYKSAIDDFKESYSDLESVFFYLPEMKDFKETTKELSLV
ncbi:hypothetical protein [uncultured Draconibacterium sp.]|uniref:hypothetical protein n=1 Tax=uncultured Draconibacterium sp. TaxID=1573823 RepID=UPI0025F1C32D|nr:hypothetical protein [uncultured Draconibacterium sp.]